MKKRLLSTLLALCLVLGLLPGTARAAESSAVKAKIDTYVAFLRNYRGNAHWNLDYTESTLTTALDNNQFDVGVRRDECKNVQRRTVNGKQQVVSHDRNHNPKSCSSNEFGGARQCHGFAKYFSYYLYGSYPQYALGSYIASGYKNDSAWTYYSKGIDSFPELQTGDFIRYNRYGRLDGANAHTVIVDYIKNGKIYVIDCNHASADDGACVITATRLSGKWLSLSVSQVQAAYEEGNAYICRHNGNATGPSNPLTATTTSGSWSVTIPANYRLSLYAGSTSANPLSKYVSAKASPYTVRCTQKAVLSNGTTRYCGKFNGNDNYWFVLTSSMKVSDNSTSTPGTYYTIYFDYHGGSGSVSYGEFPVGAAFGTLPSATRSGYTFDGWYTAATGGQKVSATDKPASGGTLHAHWTKVPTSSGNSWTVTIPANYKLPLYASSTAVNPTTKYVRAQSKPYQIHCTQKVTRSNGQIRYYASFDGGKNNLWFIYTSRMSVTQNGSSTGSYTIRFSANGGSVSPSSKTVTAGSTYGTLPTPTRSGYTFDGWYTSASGGTEVTASGKPTSSRTLYAHWKKVISYTIRFNANGGSVSPSSKTITAGSTYGTLPTPTKSGYSFNGWYTSASGGTKIAASDKPTSSRTLYAHWKKEPTSTNPTIVSGNWCVTVHPSLFYYLVLYKDAYGKTAYQHGGGGATFSRMYWCTKRSTLPDGSVLYFTETDLNAYNEYNVPAWILFDSDYMSVSTIKERVSTGYVSGTEGKNLIINSKPSSSYPTGSKIPMGETCMVIPSKSSGNWQYIKYFGVEGYVYKPYLSIGKPSTQYGTIHGTNGALAMNSKPAKGNQIYRIPEGERCLVYTGMSSGNWYWVKYNGVYGYAHKNYIRL